jgi:hypothetical protein
MGMLATVLHVVLAVCTYISLSVDMASDAVSKVSAPHSPCVYSMQLARIVN